MTAPGNDLVQVILGLALVITSGYASGRVHQWYRHGRQRDLAYRAGYDEASHSMFDMALRSRHRAVPGPGAPSVVPAALVRTLSEVAAADRNGQPANVVGSRRRRIVRT